MARLAGVDLPREKRMEVALTYIYGIGKTHAKETLAATGVSPDLRVKDLGDEDLLKLRDYIDELGYPPGLDIHSLRRSYVTHLFEHFGFDHTFVQRQVGHEHASTTSLYTAVSSDYQTSELNRVLEDMLDRAVRPKKEPR